MLPCRSFTTAGFITTFIIVVVAVVSALFCAFKFQTGRNPQSIQDVIDLVYVAASVAHALSSCGLTCLWQRRFTSYRCSYPMKSTTRSSYGRMDGNADDGECLG